MTYFIYFFQILYVYYIDQEKYQLTKYYIGVLIKKYIYGLSLKIIKQIDSYKRSYIIEITKKVQK